METARDRMRDLLEVFKESLTPREENQFRNTTVESAKSEIHSIQHDRETLKTMMGMKRLERFITLMENLDRTLDKSSLFPDAGERGEFMAFIWGPMVFLLKVCRHT